MTDPIDLEAEVRRLKRAAGVAAKQMANYIDLGNSPDAPGLATALEILEENFPDLIPWRESPATILRDAAIEVERSAWYRGQALDGEQCDGAQCAETAISQIAIQHGFWIEACEALLLHLGVLAPDARHMVIGQVMAWNDVQESKEVVVAAMRAAADAWERSNP